MGISKEGRCNRCESHKFIHVMMVSTRECIVDYYLYCGNFWHQAERCLDNPEVTRKGKNLEEEFNSIRPALLDKPRYEAKMYQYNTYRGTNFITLDPETTTNM